MSALNLSEERRRDFNAGWSYEIISKQSDENNLDFLYTKNIKQIHNVDFDIANTGELESIDKDTECTDRSYPIFYLYSKKTEFAVTCINKTHQNFGH